MSARARRPGRRRRGPARPPVSRPSPQPSAPGPAPAAPSGTQAAPRPAAPRPQAAPGPRASRVASSHPVPTYLGRELKHIGILAGAIVLLLVALSFFLKG